MVGTLEFWVPDMAIDLWIAERRIFVRNIASKSNFTVSKLCINYVSLNTYTFKIGVHAPTTLSS